MMDEDGVSEILSSILLMAIMISIFAAVVIWVGSIKTPEMFPVIDARLSLDPGNGGWGNNDEKVIVSHRGGDILDLSRTTVLIDIEGSGQNEYTGGALPQLVDDSVFQLGDKFTSPILNIAENDSVNVFILYRGEEVEDTIFQATAVALRLPVKKADLVLSSGGLSAETATAEGQKIKIYALIKNEGETNAEKFKVGVFDGNPKEGGNLIGLVETSIMARSKLRISIPFEVFFDPMEGETSVFVYADCMNEIPERSENNNIGSIGIGKKPEYKGFFLDNCEGEGEWTHEGDQDEWEQGNPGDWYGPTMIVVQSLHPNSPHWGDGCWGSDMDNTYNNLANTSLISPAINLIEARTATLSFWQWYDFETDWDRGYLEISRDGGDTWHLLDTYSGHQTWNEIEIDLTQWAGNEINFRFRYETDKYGTRAGWYIDDVSVVSE